MIELVLVDDAQEDLGLLERVLRQCKILNPIHRLSSGMETISFLREEKQQGVHYLVLLDLIMAPVSGISVLRTLKAEGTVEDCIFVMLSGITDIKAINDGYQLGAFTFMVKPIKPEDVMEMLNGLRNRIAVRQAPEGYLLEEGDFYSLAQPIPRIIPMDRTLSISAA